MKFKGRLTKLWCVSIIVINAVMLALFFTTESFGSQMMCLPVLVLMDVYMIPVLFQNYVVIDKYNLEINFGILRKVIPVKRITSVSSTVSYKASFATSTKRLAINGLGKEPIYISLEDTDSFVKELIKKNNKIKYYIGEK